MTTIKSTNEPRHWDFPKGHHTLYKGLVIAICIVALALLAACGQGNTPEDEYEAPEPQEAHETQEPQEPTPYEVEEAEVAPLPATEGIHGLLSVVEYGNNRAYIIGSIHVGQESWYPLSSVVEAAMDSADIFAFEIDLGADGGPCLCEPETCDCGCEPDTNDCVCLLMELMFLPEATTLVDFLPPEDLKMFMESLSTFPINLEAITIFRPTTIMELILYQIIAPTLGLSSEHSIDMYVFDRAQAMGRPTIGLTDFNDHIAFVSGMPEEYQFATARYFSDYDTMLEEMEELAHVYQIQDILTLTQMVRTDLEEAYEAYHAGEITAGGLGLARYWHYTVGNYRSAFFARQIADLLTQTQEPTTFFVTVGIAHLTREINVFYVLESMGFEPQLLVNLG